MKKKNNPFPQLLRCSLQEYVNRIDNMLIIMIFPFYFHASYSLRFVPTHHRLKKKKNRVIFVHLLFDYDFFASSPHHAHSAIFPNNNENPLKPIGECGRAPLFVAIAVAVVVVVVDVVYDGTKYPDR